MVRALLLCWLVACIPDGDVAVVEAPSLGATGPQASFTVYWDFVFNGSCDDNGVELVQINLTEMPMSAPVDGFPVLADCEQTQFTATALEAGSYELRLMASQSDGPLSYGGVLFIELAEDHRLFEVLLLP
ncbi:MAG: hypothetical protein AAGA48_08335 [Myxococcota bacterium]